MLNKELRQLRWIYYDAKYRCTNPRHKRYSDYGGRGIKFLFSSFQEWLNCMGPRPIGFEMDRIDNTGHYRDWETDRKSTRLNSSHSAKSRMPSSA